MSATFAAGERLPRFAEGICGAATADRITDGCGDRKSLARTLPPATEIVLDLEMERFVNPPVIRTSPIYEASPRHCGAVRRSLVHRGASLLIADYLSPGISVVDTPEAPHLMIAMSVALVLAVMNAVVRPALLVLTLPLNISRSASPR